MLKKLVIAFAAIAAVTITSIAPANAIGLGSSRNGAFTKQFRKSESTIVAPIAFTKFCQSNPRECRASGASTVAYTSKLRGTLASVNSSVNRSISPRNERMDKWSINPRFGDCDDYVMTKRHRLIRAGVPSSALRIAVVRTPRGVSHAILIVKTSAGELALDNLRSSIVKRSQTGYRFEKVSTANPLQWTRF